MARIAGVIAMPGFWHRPLRRDSPRRGVLLHRRRVPLYCPRAAPWITQLPTAAKRDVAHWITQLPAAAFSSSPPNFLFGSTPIVRLFTSAGEPRRAAGRPPPPRCYATSPPRPPSPPRAERYATQYHRHGHLCHSSRKMARCCVVETTVNTGEGASFLLLLLTPIPGHQHIRELRGGGCPQIDIAL